MRAERPDVVLLDLSMPVMDGLEALPSIRRLVPAAKIIVLSGFGATQMSERALATGADGYLQKGMSLKRILDYVRGIVDGTTDHATAVARAHPGPASARAGRAARPPTAPHGGATAGAASTQPQPADAPSRRRSRTSRPGTRSRWRRTACSRWPTSRCSGSCTPTRTAQRLLENRARFGVPLGTIAPLLTNLVAFNRLDGEASFVADVGGVGVHATLRRASSSLLIYLDSTAEDIGVLRRAIATTAHEIRGPVAVLCGIAESISQDGDEMTEAQRARLMSSVTRQARVLDSITADLLTAAELQRGSLRLDPQAVDADRRHRLGDQRPLPGRPSTRVVEDERKVLADPLRLEQMLGNLVGNALKYGRAPFVVRRPRRTSNDATMVAIDVTDAGDGVPEEFQRPAVPRVHRGPAAGRHRHRARALRRPLARRGAGRARQYTTAASGGACFTLTLPAV